MLAYSAVRNLSAPHNYGRRIIAEVDGFHGNQYAHLWCDLQHRLVRSKRTNQFGQFFGWNARQLQP